MKTLYAAVIVTSTLTWASATKTLAQDEPQSPSAPPAPPTPVVILHDAQKMAEDAVHKAQGDVEKQMGQVQQNLTRLKDHLRAFGRHIIGGKPLVVRSSDMTLSDQGNLEEDLTVMTHILDKTLAEKFPDDESGRVAMGISVSFVPGEAPMRSLYLDGYGALFFVRVNFPLLAPPLEKNVESQKAPADSTWEEAREEVYGQPGTVDSLPVYDAAKVSALQGALLDAMKDASNIRNVKPDESITVCVIGAPSEAPKLAKTLASVGGGGGGGGGGFGALASRVGGSSGSQDSAYGHAVVNYDRLMADFSNGGRDAAAENKTTLTIRVKKADCEAFAKGKLTADEFRSRALVRIYGDPIVAP